jgi:hypothetical protein
MGMPTRVNINNNMMVAPAEVIENRAMSANNTVQTERRVIESSKKIRPMFRLYILIDQVRVSNELGGRLGRFRFEILRSPPADRNPSNWLIFHHWLKHFFNVFYHTSRRICARRHWV